MPNILSPSGNFISCCTRMSPPRSQKYKRFMVQYEVSYTVYTMWGEYYVSCFCFSSTGSFLHFQITRLDLFLCLGDEKLATVRNQWPMTLARQM